MKKCASDSGITYTGWGNDCGGFTPPAKGEHLDTQLFPKCRKKKGKKKKNSFNLKEYKLAERTKMNFRNIPGIGIIGTIDPKELTVSKLEMIKEWLEKNYPDQYWTVKSVYDWVKYNFFGKLPSERNVSSIEEIRKPYKGWLPKNVKER